MTGRIDPRAVWHYVHPGLMLASIASSLALPAVERLPRAALAVGMVAVGSFAARTAMEGRSALRFANGVTLSRPLLFAIALAGASWSRCPLVWATVFSAAAVVTDLADGILARNYGATEFGGMVDMEADAFGVLVLSLLAFTLSGVGVWVLAAGLLRYLYAPAEAWLESRRQLPWWFRRQARRLSAGATLCLLVAVAPGVPPPLGLMAALAAVAALLYSFSLAVGIQLGGRTVA